MTFHAAALANTVLDRARTKCHLHPIADGVPTKKPREFEKGSQVVQALGVDHGIAQGGMVILVHAQVELQV